MNKFATLPIQTFEPIATSKSNNKTRNKPLNKSAFDTEYKTEKSESKFIVKVNRDLVTTFGKLSGTFTLVCGPIVGCCS